MKKTTLILLVTLFLASFSYNNPTDDIINKIVQVRGGANALKEIKDQTQVWTLSDAEGNVSKCIMKYKRPNKYKMEIRTLDGKNIIISSTYNGSKGSQNVFGQEREMSAQELEEYNMVSKLFVDGVFNHGSKNIGVKYIKDQIINDVNYKVIEISNGNGQFKNIFYNPQTGYVDSEEGDRVNIITMEKEKNKVEFKNWKKYGDVMYPTYLKVNGSQVFKLDKLMSNSGLDDSEFSVN